VATPAWNDVKKGVATEDHHYNYTFYMPLPLAHGLIGASVAAAIDRSPESIDWRKLLVAALLGVFPDFDYALNWLRISGGGWHHGFTHSIFFAVFLGVITGIIFKEKTARGFIVFAAAAASHTLLDFLITESQGVALWWPLTDHRYKLLLPNPIDYTWSNVTIWTSAVGVLTISLTELALFGPILLSVILVKRLLGSPIRKPDVNS
jgi:membrane-bound metal-dependent hydrolase YbcI (DUF457 family)